MNGERTYTDYFIAGRLWLSTAAAFATGACIFFIYIGDIEVAVLIITLGFVVACVGSLPAYLFLYLVILWIAQGNSSLQQKTIKLVITCLLTAVLYALL